MKIDSTCNVSIRMDGNKLISKIEDAFSKYTWMIHTPYTAGLTYSEINFIRRYSPTFDWVDSKCAYYAYDNKLPSGRWLKNITINWRTNTITAEVM